MRELKLRAFWKIFKEMRYFSGAYIQCGYKDFQTGILIPIDNTKRSVYMGGCETMESTGLKDKNGKEIYEGDIIGLVDSQGDLVKHEIKWDTEDYAAFIGINIGYPTLKSTLRQTWLNECGFEIIGNIYENPELLEKK